VHRLFPVSSTCFFIISVHFDLAALSLKFGRMMASYSALVTSILCISNKHVPWELYLQLLLDTCSKLVVPGQ
jgi:hypothetical protein